MMHENLAADPVAQPLGAVPTDLESLLQRPDLLVVPLRRNDREILDALPGLGWIACTTTNDCASCTTRSCAASVCHIDQGTAIFQGAPNLCWLEDSWHYSVAALRRDEIAKTPCLMLFGAQGDLAHRIEPIALQAWEPFRELIETYKGCLNCLRHIQAPCSSVQAFDCPGSLLREAWHTAHSDRDLDSRLAGLGLNRLQALRAMEGLYASPVSFERLGSLMERIVSRKIPVHIQVRNRHCTQILEGCLKSAQRHNKGWEFRGRDMAIHLMPSRMQSIWFVTQPSHTGERDRIECYDNRGERALVLCPPQTEESRILTLWQQILSELDPKFSS